MGKSLVSCFFLRHSVITECVDESDDSNTRHTCQRYSTVKYSIYTTSTCADWSDVLTCIHLCWLVRCPHLYRCGVGMLGSISIVSAGAAGLNPAGIGENHHVSSVLWCCCFGGRKGIRPVKNWVVGAGVVISLEQGAGLHMAQRIPLPLTVCCFSKIQTGFTFLVPAHPGSPGQRAVKWVCVCVCDYN